MPPLPSALSEGSLSTSEKLILMKGSKLYEGHPFWPWDKEPSDAEFQGESYRDDFEYRLSGLQFDILSGWRKSDVDDATWKKSLRGKLDLVQDVTNDCSIVASLCVANARAAKIGSEDANVFSKILYPFKEPSKNGKYVVRLQFNGCWRKVVIDDYLPVTSNDQLLHVTARDDSSVVWPALIEKSMLKVNGGYDFPGSDTSNDLWMLSGWIPERVPLLDNSVGQEELWKRIATTFQYGDVMLSLGTPKMSLLEENVYGLASGHDYAVIDMKEENDVKKLLVKNPWSHANDHLRAATSRTSKVGLEVILEDDSDGEMPTSPVSTELPGTRWMDLNDVFRRFKTMYLSWNPEIFPYRQDVHFAHDLKKLAALGSFTHCPQYSVRSSKSCTVWFLLSRHIPSYPTRHHEELGYIGLYAFKSDVRVMLSDRSIAKTSYVNCDSVLLRMDIEANTQYVIVISSQDLPSEALNFTLTAFSRQPLDHLNPTASKYGHLTAAEGSWSISTAGGNSSSPLYHLNPQFSLNVTQPTDLGLLLSTPKQGYSVNVQLVWAKGKRIQPGLPSRNIYASSGEYRRNSALAEVKNVQPGLYTIVCSTFETGHRAPFNLQLFSTAPGCALKAAPSDDAGMFRHAFMPVEFKQGMDRVLCPLTVTRTCKVKVKAQGMSSSKSSRSPLKIALEYGQGPHTQILATSGDPKSDQTALTLSDVLIQTRWCIPPSPGVWLVVERVGGAFVSQTEKVFVEVLCSADGLQAGQWGQETDLPIEEMANQMRRL